MAGKQRTLVELVFGAMFLVAIAGLLVAHFVTDQDVYLGIAGALVVIGWPLEWVVRKLVRGSGHRGQSTFGPD